MKTFVLAVVVLLPTAAFAQTDPLDPQATTGTMPAPGASGLSTAAPGTVNEIPTDPGQLEFGSRASGGGAPSGPAANPDQLDLGRTPSGGLPSAGAGIGAGVPGTDDVYTRPIYGGSR